MPLIIARVKWLFICSSHVYLVAREYNKNSPQSRESRVMPASSTLKNFLADRICFVSSLQQSALSYSIDWFVRLLWKTFRSRLVSSNKVLRPWVGRVTGETPRRASIYHDERFFGEKKGDEVSCLLIHQRVWSQLWLINRHARRQIDKPFVIINSLHWQSAGNWKIICEIFTLGCGELAN